MPSSIYTAWSVIAGEQPTTAKWNVLGSNDGSFNTGVGMNDGVIISRHLAAGITVSNVAYNPYKFKCYPSAVTSMASSTWTKVAINTAVFDTSSNFNLSTNRFVVPITGFYCLCAQVAITQSGSTSGQQQAAMYKNGSLFILASTTPASGSGSSIGRPNICIFDKFTAGDYIELYGYCGEAGRAVDGGTTVTYMSGFLVSAT
jgi:hypothetical protein